MRLQLQQLLESRVRQCVSQQRGKQNCEKIERKKTVLSKREGEIVKAKAKGQITNKKEQDETVDVFYSVHLQYLIKQKELMYIEEEIEKRKATFYREQLIEDIELDPPATTYNIDTRSLIQSDETIEAAENRYYNRLKAVQYAERWWNSYNPAYMKFENDCTNFISQCLHQGGAPMRGYPTRGQGWWMKGKSYSYSWATANALKVYFDLSKLGLRAERVSSPEQLSLGDVICYDFEGDGRFNHNTIVTGKDAFGMPLVNAHTYNSRQRYWAYEDSSAYTPNIKYRFYTIVGE
jgi:hypothetical protein